MRGEKRKMKIYEWAFLPQTRLQKTRGGVWSSNTENLPSVIHSLSLHSKVKLWSRMHWCGRVRSLHLELECIQNCQTTFKQQALSVWCSNCNHWSSLLSFTSNTANSLHAPQYTFSHSGTVTWRTSSSRSVSFWHWGNDFAIHIWMEPDEWSW